MSSSKNAGGDLVKYNELIRWREETLLTKEPETLEWIKRMPKNGIFVDVGANIGIYSMVASEHLSEDGLVVAIEPQPNNIAYLLKDSFRGQTNILAIYGGLGPVTRLGRFALPNDPRPGSTGGFVAFTSEMDKETDLLCSIYALDDLANWLHLTPTHIKLDIDVGTWGALDGMKWSLAHRDFKSILIEIDRYDEDSLVHRMRSFGLYLDEELMALPNHSNNRRKADPHNNTRNLIFKKES